MKAAVRVAGQFADRCDGGFGREVCEDGEGAYEAYRAPVVRRFIWGSKKNPLDEWEIEGRAFSAKVIPPGQSASGLLYFRTPETSAAASVYISGLANAVTGKQLYYFEIPLSGKWPKLSQIPGFRRRTQILR